MNAQFDPNFSDERLENEAVATCLAKLGFKVFPCNPQTKAPLAGIKWKEMATVDLDQIAAWWKAWPEAMPGMPTGYANAVSVVDLDIHGDKDGITAYRGMGLTPGAASVIVRTAGGGLHLYFDHEEDVRNSATKAGIDVRGEGGYVIAPSAVSKAGRYTIEKGDMSVARLLGFGTFPEMLKRPALAPQDNQSKKAPLSLSEIAEPLFRIPNDGPYDDWVKILMAVHHSTGGSKGGLALVQAWSSDYPNYDPKEVMGKWRSFGKSEGVKITSETLFAEARKCGWHPISADDFDDDVEDDLPETDYLSVDDDEVVKPVDTGRITFLTPDQCANLPARDYVVKQLIAPGQIGCVFGEPGAGKSLIAPWLAYGIAQGTDVFGLRTKAGPVFYVACEDEDGMAGRVAALHDDLGAADDFHLVRGCSDLFSPGQIAGKGSPDLIALAKQVKAVRPRVIVIDTLAMAMPGLEENDAAGMNRVVGVGKQLARFGAAVVFVHHGTKAEGNTPRGHSVFNGALDFSIMVKAADQNGIVRGIIRKNRNGPPDLDIAFKIGTCRVGTDIDGEPVDAPVCLPCDPTQAFSEPKLTRSQSATLDLISRMSEGKPLDEAEFRRAACDDFAISGSDKRDSRQKAVARALSELVRKGKIKINNNLIYFPQPVEDLGWEDDLDELLS